MDIKMELIEPEFAKAILATKNNINIRKIRKPTVANYARQMADGNWHYGCG